MHPKTQNHRSRRAPTLKHLHFSGCFSHGSSELEARNPAATHLVPSRLRCPFDLRNYYITASLCRATKRVEFARIDYPQQHSNVLLLDVQGLSSLKRTSSQANAFGHSRGVPSVLPSPRGLNSENPDSFRSILLIAALHFAWRTGNLGEYERTYLYHKVKAIESVNKYLNDLSRKGDLTCMSTVATLCLVEVGIFSFYRSWHIWTNMHANREVWAISPRQSLI